MQRLKASSHRLRVAELNLPTDLCEVKLSLPTDLREVKLNNLPTDLREVKFAIDESSFGKLSGFSVSRVWKGAESSQHR